LGRVTGSQLAWLPVTDGPPASIRSPAAR
jgi:hypothetical protein